VPLLELRFPSSGYRLASFFWFLIFVSPSSGPTLGLVVAAIDRFPTRVFFAWSEDCAVGNLFPLAAKWSGRFSCSPRFHARGAPLVLALCCGSCSPGLGLLREMNFWCYRSLVSACFGSQHPDFILCTQVLTQIFVSAEGLCTTVFHSLPPVFHFNVLPWFQSCEPRRA
jgi:hypothetical protein